MSESIKDLNDFEDAQKNMINLKEHTSKLKDFASDLHVFLGTRQVFKTVNEDIKSMKLVTCRSRSYDIEFDLHPNINHLFEQFDQFGKIKLEKHESSLQLYDAKIGQAQIQRSQIKVFRV